METSVAVTVSLPPTVLNTRQELFAQELVAGASLTDAYRAAGYKVTSPESAWAAAARLRAYPAVQERLRVLKAAAAERALIKPAVLLQELYELATADPAELTRVVTDPCSACWSNEALGVAADRWLAGQGEAPDTDKPQPGCKSCRGRGISRVVHTPTADLSGAARRLYAGAKTKSDGSVEVATVDQLGARKELHALLGMHVQRSESKNLTVHATVDAKATDVSADNLLALWKESRS